MTKIKTRREHVDNIRIRERERERSTLNQTTEVK